MTSTMNIGKDINPVEFDDIFKSFIAHVKQNLNLVEVSANFTSDKTYIQLISSTLPLLKEWSFFDNCISLISSNKNDQLSDSFRSQGNPFYGKKLLQEALIEYNKSIQHAQHPSWGETLLSTSPVIQSVSEEQSTFSTIEKPPVGREYRSLALAYANRSAVLFDLGLFHQTLEDLTRCLRLGYPNKKNKLALRKAKCIVHLEVASLCQELLKKSKYVGKKEELTADLYHSSQIKIEGGLKSFVDVHLTESEVDSLNEDVQYVVDEFISKISLKKNENSDSNHGKIVAKTSQSLEGVNHNVKKGVIYPKLYEKGVVQLFRTSVPVLKKEHASIKGLSVDTSLVYQHGRGRYLVAAQDIYPGTVLAMDPGYGGCGVVLPSHCSSVCASCLTSVLAPLPCPSCSMVADKQRLCTQVVFCSDECCRVALSSFHGHECRLLATLHSLDMGRNSELALRMVTVAGLPGLRNMVQSFSREEENKRKPASDVKKQLQVAERDCQVSADTLEDHAAATAALSTMPKNSANVSNSNNNVNPELLEGFNPSGIYDSQDYRSIYYLVGNKEARSVGDIFKRSVMACLLVKLLEKGGTFFRPFSNGAHSSDKNLSDSLLSNNASSIKSRTETVDLPSEDFGPMLDDQSLVGSVLLRHIMNLPCNAHSITRYHVNNENLSSNYSEDVGANAYGVLSLTNHSCAPNCYRQSYGAVGVLRATEIIPRGTEISDCYCAHFAVEGRVQRQEKLKMQYLFSCGCRACVEDWHLFDCDCSAVCKQTYCRGCGEDAKCCFTKGCGKFLERKPVEFRLKCMTNECKGFMKAITGSCSVCRKPYENINSLLNFSPDINFNLQNVGLKHATPTIDSSLSDIKSSPRTFPLNDSQVLVEDSISHHARNTPSSSKMCDVITISGLIDLLEQRLDDYNTASEAILAGHAFWEELVSGVEELVYLLSRLVVQPNKALLRAQEMLKHCHDRLGCYMLLPKQMKHGRP